MSNVAGVLKDINKQYGGGIVSEGVEIVDEERLPSSTFAFDLATGGGFPKGRISIVYGPESSLKTTMALRAIAQSQRENPNMKCVFIDVEVSYNPEWGASLGVDNEKLIYVLPDYAEQVVDIAEAFMYAEDVAIVVIDSLAALITTQEIDSSAEKANVGGSGLVVGKLYRKVTLALSRAKKEGRKPIFIAINQIRFKIGVMYGNPEVMPGGVAFLFASSLTIRMYGKDELDKKINAVLPAYKICTGIIKKWKVPICARTFEFKLATLPQKSKGLKVGDTDDWNTLVAYLKEYKLLVKTKKGWELEEVEFKTLNAIWDHLIKHSTYADMLRSTLIQMARNKGMLEEDAEEEEL